MSWPEIAMVYDNTAYTDCAYSDVLQDGNGISLTAFHRRNSTRPLDECICHISECVRKHIDTSFSQIADLFAKRIHAVIACSV